MRLRPDEITIVVLEGQWCDDASCTHTATERLRLDILGNVVYEGVYCREHAKKRRAELLAAED